MQMQIFKQMNTFAMWSLSSAAQVLSRQIKGSDGDASDAFSSLQLLHSVMETLEDKTTSWDGLIHEIRLQLHGESL